MFPGFGDSWGLTPFANPGQSRISGAVCRKLGDCTRVCPADTLARSSCFQNGSAPVLHLEPAIVCYRGVSMGRRAVVFGAAGQLGTELVRELQQRRFNVMAWDRSQVDITNPVAVQDALANCDAEVVFNAAAYN